MTRSKRTPSSRRPELTQVLSAALAVLLAAAQRAPAQTPQTIKGGTVAATVPSYGAYRAPLGLPALHVTVTPPDATQWTTQTNDLGNGLHAESLTGTLEDGTAVTFTVLTVSSRTCGELLENQAAQSGARRLISPPFLPAEANPLTVQVASGSTLFCIPTPGGIVVFSVTPSGYSGAQLLAVQRMASAIGLAAAGGTGASGLSSQAVAAGLTAPVYLSGLGLTIGTLPDAGWTAGMTSGGSGTPMDRVQRTGGDGNPIVVTISSHVTGSSCEVELTRFLESGLAFGPAPTWLDVRFYQRVVNGNSGSLVCLPLANGLLVGVVSRVNDGNAADVLQVRILLAGLRLAAFDRWGAP